MSSIKSIAVVAVALLDLLLAGGAQANMITNGSFETNTGSAANAWDCAATTTFGSAVDFGVSPAPEGTQVAKLQVGPANQGDDYLYSNSVLLTAGTTYTYSFYVKSNLDNAQLRIANIYLQKMGVGADYYVLEYYPSTTWTQYSSTFTPSADGTARVYMFNYLNTGGYTSYVDDFQLNAVPVPEPATVVLLGALGTVLLLRRRRG